MLRRLIVSALLSFGPIYATYAQTGDAAIVPQENNAPDGSIAPPEDKRVFGVLPNYRTAESSVPFHPISSQHKITIALKDSFDWPSYLTGGLFAGLYQLENQNPSWGQGMTGYAKRYASAVGDQIIGNMMTEGIFPALGHQDPRYFRLGSGPLRHRAWYAVTSIFVARMDSGHRMFNFSEWGGNASAVAISNLYYPADQHNPGANVEKLMLSCGTDALSNVAKEFWPDVKRYFQHRRDRKQQAQLP